MNNIIRNKEFRMYDYIREIIKILIETQNLIYKEKYLEIK